MRFLNRLAVILTFCGLFVAGSGMLEARNNKAWDLYQKGQQSELEEDWDTALDYYEQAFAEDPKDTAYQIAVRRAHFEAGRVHIARGKDLLAEGKLEEALTEFQDAFAIDPSSSIAEQELRRAYRMIRDLKEARKNGESEANALLTPTERARQEAEERMERIQPIPELKPISRNLSTLRMNNQPTKVLYETLGKLAGINVVFDPEFQASGTNLTVDLSNTTLEEALEYLSVLTKTYWKPLSENTIFITNDNVTKRRDHEEMVVKVFYLKNITTVQQLQEIATAVRSVTDIRRMFTYNAQNAIIVRGAADQVALAEKLFYDLDKPLSEVVVDVIVMEASRSRTRQLAASIVSSSGDSGIHLPISFNPLDAVTNSGGGDESDSTSSDTSLRLSTLGSLSINDFTTTMPGALLQALLTDGSTRILQRPQVRAANGQAASLRLGDRVPYATGSYSSGVGTVSVSALVSTQFQYADVGVNVDLTPAIHDETDVSMHIEVEISSVRERIDVGGIEQPVIGQRTITEDIRVRDGEVTLLGGLTQSQTTRSKGGVPGLSDIPIIKWLGFNDETKDTTESELLIALIPHIVRRPDISELNLRGVAAGSDQVVKVRMAPKSEPEETPAIEEIGAPPAAAATPSDAETPAEAEPAAAPEPPAPGAALGFNPPAVTIKRGETFNVSLELANATDVYNAPMKFEFDSQILQMVDVRQGELLRGDGQQVIFTRNILNDSGSASIVLNRLPGAGGMSGSGTLVVLTFRAVGPGTTQVGVPDLTIRDSQMQPISVTAPALAVTVEE